MITKLTPSSLQQIVSHLHPVTDKAEADKEINELLSRHDKLINFAGGGILHNFGKQLLNCLEELYKFVFKDLKWNEATFFWTDRKIINYLKDEASAIKADKSDKNQLENIIDTVTSTAKRCMALIRKTKPQMDMDDLDRLIGEISKRAIYSKKITTQTEHEKLKNNITITASSPQTNVITKIVEEILPQQIPPEVESPRKI